MKNMKTAITALCVLAVAVGSVQALVKKDLTNRAEKSNVLLQQEDLTVGRGDMKVNSTFTPSNAYNTGYHGFSHRRFDFDHITYDPTTGLYGTVFDLKTPAGVKSTGGMASIWGGGNESELLNGSDASGVWNQLPDVTGIDNYVVAILPHEGATGPWLKIAVYDKVEEAWSTPFTVEAPNGSKPEKVYSCHGAMTKDGSGNYYLMLTTVHKFTDWVNREESIIVGKTTNPFAGPWTFSDYSQNLVKAGNGGQFAQQTSDFKGAWGKNGFGIAVMNGEQAADTSGLGVYGYSWTKDYGQNWQKANPNGDMYIIPMDQQMFPWIGTPTGGASSFDIIRTTLGGSLDLLVDDNNDVHMMSYVWAGGNGSSYYPNLLNNEEGLFVQGYYHLNRKFDMTGNPETTNWTANHIANPIGWKSEDTPDDAAITDALEKKGGYTNTKIMHLSDGGNGVLVAQWNDRQSGKNPLDETTFGTQVGVPAQNNSYTYIQNPYLSVSTDGGQTWSLTQNDSVKQGFEIKTYTDPQVHELGFSIAKKSKVTGTGNNMVIETYAGYGIPNLAAPCPVSVSGASAPGTSHNRWEQSWYVMQLKIGADVGISTEEMALTKNFTLAQNYPNPFNPATAINFNLQNAGSVKLSVFNAQGQEVANLINAKMTQGAHSANFNAANLNSGVYFYKLTVDGQSAVKKMVLTK